MHYTPSTIRARLLAAMLTDAYAAQHWPEGPDAWRRHIEAQAAMLDTYAQAVYRAEVRILPLERAAQAEAR